MPVGSKVTSGNVIAVVFDTLYTVTPFSLTSLVLSMYTSMYGYSPSILTVLRIFASVVLFLNPVELMLCIYAPVSTEEDVAYSHLSPA